MTALKPKNFLNEDGTLTCRVCNVAKSLTRFSRNRANSTGYERVCKSCARIKAMEWRSRNKQSRSAPPAELSSNQRARRRAATSTPIPTGWRLALFEYFGNKCLRCGSRERLQADHVWALSRGGAHMLENMQPLCASCNLSKQASYADYRDGAMLTPWVMQGTPSQ